MSVVAQNETVRGLQMMTLMNWGPRKAADANRLIRVYDWMTPGNLSMYRDFEALYGRPQKRKAVSMGVRIHGKRCGYREGAVSQGGRLSTL